MRRAFRYKPAFVRAAKDWTKKHPQASEALGETLRLLEEDAFNPRLRTHKLKGELAGSWACSGGYDLRIVFEIVTQGGEEFILLGSLGTHDEVY